MHFVRDLTSLDSPSLREKKVAQSPSLRWLDTAPDDYERPPRQGTPRKAQCMKHDLCLATEITGTATTGGR